jgi:hypothetical protein
MDVNAPYLPPDEPTDNPAVPKKKKAWRTVLLWLLLILMFVAIYQFLGGGSAPRHAHTPPSPTCEPSWWSSVAPVGVPIAIIGAFILLMWRQLRGTSKFNNKLEPGLLALADGDLGRAAEVFTAVAHEFRKQTAYAAAAKVSLVTAWSRQGQLQKAIEAAIDVERAPGLLFGSEVRLHASIHLATLYALRGDVATARRWCESARQRLARAQNRTYAAAILRLAEVLVLARAGERQEALRALERDWRRLEESLTATTMKKALVLRAFCAVGDANRGSTGPWLSLVRKGELQWMAVEWPELQAFLAAHDV